MAKSSHIRWSYPVEKRNQNAKLRKITALMSQKIHFGWERADQNVLCLFEAMVQTLGISDQSAPKISYLFEYRQKTRLFPYNKPERITASEEGLDHTLVLQPV